MPETNKTTTQKKEAATKEKLVRIRLPKMRADQDDVRVWVNQRSWQIQRGVEVDVPECVAEVLRNKEKALETIMLFTDENAKEF